jgi:CHAT domain-containing protein
MNIVRASIVCCALVLLIQGEAQSSYREMLARADSLAQRGHIDSAITVTTFAAEKVRSDTGVGDTSLAEVLVQLAGFYDSQDSLEAAENCWLEALEIRRLALGKRHADVAACYRGLGSLAYARGDYVRADSMYSTACGIWEALPVPDSLSFAKTLNRLASSKLGQGRYPEAEYLYLQALAITDTLIGHDSPRSLELQTNLALARMWLGKYGLAAAQYEHIIEVMETEQGVDIPALAPPLSMLALIYRKDQKYSASEAMTMRAIAIRERSLGADHPSLITNFSNLANVYRYQKRYAETEEACRRYADIVAVNYGEDSYSHAEALAELAAVYYDQGKTAELATVYDRISGTYDRISRAGRATTALSLEKFAWRFRQHDPVRCLRLARRAFDIRHQNLVDNSRNLSESDALRFSEFTRKAASIFLSCFFDIAPDSKESWQAAAAVVLAAKGNVSDEMFQRRRFQESNEDSIAAALTEKLQGTRDRLANLYVSGPKGDDEVAYRQSLDSLTRKKSAIEAELGRISEPYRRRQIKRHVSSARICGMIPDDAQLVEYMRYYYWQSDPDTVITHYLVVVADAHDGIKAVLELGPASPIDSVVASYRDHMLTAASYAGGYLDLDAEYRVLSQQLYAFLWRPVEKHLSDGKTTLLAPDGSLYLVSFAGLIDADTRFLAERNTIHYLTTGRDLLRLQEDVKEGHGLLAVGDPDFNATAAKRADASVSIDAGEYIASAPILQSESRLRNVRSMCIDQLDVLPLPGTAHEVVQTTELWSAAVNDDVTTLVGLAASEDNFRRLAPGRRMLHLATHGFFLPSDCRPGDTADEDAPPHEYAGDNPLLLSGLLLAGSNLHGRAADSIGVDDGILTAEEISNLDLSGVDCVVLSACESGLGRGQGGEGVYGLRRAFELAGARSLVSSLWPVSDRMATEFAVHLYGNLGKPWAQNIGEYQRQTISKLRSHGYSDHPVQWAAFMASGDWR